MDFFFKNLFWVGINKDKFLFYLVAFCIFCSSLLTFQSVTFTPDAYYYFTISKNFANGNGLTFDNYDVTTGFHPLWLLVLTFIHKISNNTEIFLYIVYFVQTILFLTGYYFLYTFCNRIKISKEIFIILTIPIFVFNISIFLSGVENSLQFFLICSFLILFSQKNINKTYKEISITICLILLYFTRLDSIFLLIIYYPYFLYQAYNGKRFKIGLVHSILVGVVISLHLLLMYLYYGSIHPTSSLAIKKFLSITASSNFFETISPTSHILTERIFQLITKLGFNISLSGNGRYLGLLVPLAFLVTFFIVLTNKRIMFKAPIIMIGVMAIIQFSYYVIFNNGWMRQWYFNGWFIIFVIGTCFICSKNFNFIFRFKDKLIFKLIFIFIPISIFLFLKINTFGCSNYNENRKLCVSWKYFSDQSQILLDYNTKDFILAGWTPDRATFFSGVGILHLEGLVNSYEYINNYLPDKIDQYLKDRKVTHFIISNEPYLATKVRCKILITSNMKQNIYVYGLLRKRNSYIAVYEVFVANTKADKTNLKKIC